jgi:NADPH-dependent curcumin reductase CurA
LRQTVQNIVLASRPHGHITADNWRLTETAPEALQEGSVRVRVQYVSLDPAMRGWMNEGKSYLPPVQLGAPMRALALGCITETKAPGLSVGTYVTGGLGVRTEACVPAQEVAALVPGADVPLTHHLSVLGMPALTAYFGLFEVGQAKKGDTVVVSGAAGTVGLVVGQIAKARGCRVVGIAGGLQKCQHIENLGFDAAIDYKKEDVLQRLGDHCPTGIDVYFDNVGGDVLDAALAHLARNARVALCGAITQYNETSVRGPSNYLSLLINRARMQGFIVFDYMERYPEALEHLTAWLKAGKLKMQEHVMQGIENFPHAVTRMFEGKHIGKLLLKID